MPVNFGGSFEVGAGFERIYPITRTFDPTGTMTLTINGAVPEPSSLGLVIELRSGPQARSSHSGPSSGRQSRSRQIDA